MADRLQGTELRVFRSLVFKRECDTLVAIQTELTSKPEPDQPEIEQAVEGLVGRGYIEEFELGRWRVSLSGYEVRQSLLSDMPFAD